MPARNTRFRAVKEEVRLILDRNDAWPPIKALIHRVKNKGGGRRADIVDMKAGARVAEKYVISLVEILKEKSSIHDVLRSGCIESNEGMDIDELIDLLADPTESHALSATGTEDWHLKGLDGLVGLFTDYVWHTLVRPGTICKNEDDVRLATDMVMASTGRQVGGKSKLDAPYAFMIAERHMQISRENYQARAIERWRTARWAIAFAVVDRRRVGCSYILPLSKLTYEQLQAGGRDIHSCSSPDLSVPSNTLFLEAVGHMSDLEYPWVAKKTAQTTRTIFLQMAMLSLDLSIGMGQENSLRILSIAGCRMNEKRLRRSGFRATGTKIPGFNIGFMQIDERKAWFIPLVVRKLQDRLIESGEYLTR